MRILARFFALAPFVLGFVRVAQAGDTRVLALAAASFIGAAIAIIANRSLDRSSTAAARTAILVGACATLAAILAGFFIQHTVSVGAAMFAIVFGISWGLGYALDARSRSRLSETSGS